MSQKNKTSGAAHKSHSPERSLFLNQLRSVDRKLKRVTWEQEVLAKERQRILAGLKKLDQPDLPIA